MAKYCVKFFLFIMLTIFLTGCISGKAQKNLQSETEQKGISTDVSNIKTQASGSSNSFVVDPEKLDFGSYMEEEVDNFLVIFDASGSKFLPYKQQIKFKVAKDILRRFNQKTPNRPLFGGLRRYGWEAGAFTTTTSLLYGMTNYSRNDYADAIEIMRWSGGKTPLALAIDKGSDDLELAPKDEYLAMVIISDGKVLKGDPNPVMAARRAKNRYGDRICIYTVAIGDDIPFDKKGTPDNKRRYHKKYKLLRDIAKEGKCGYMVTSDDLIPDENMAQFAHDVFHRGHSFEPEPRAIEPCPDEDGDGVCDDQDRCPGTPKGAKVDKDGCWILDKVQFDLNKWNIKSEYRPILNEIARVLKMNPGVALAIQGHTCTIWTEEYNMKLSQWRAISVRTYLLNKGVKANQLTVEGFGYHRPFASNETEEGRILNRRAEFRRIR